MNTSRMRSHPGKVNNAVFESIDHLARGVNCVNAVTPICFAASPTVFPRLIRISASRSLLIIDSGDVHFPGVVPTSMIA